MTVRVTVYVPANLYPCVAVELTEAGPPIEPRQL